jgi:hypothetical protein
MMITIKQRLLLILIFTLPVLFLSGCEDADLDLLEMVFEAWAEENGLYEDGEYKPQNVVEKAVDDYLGSFTNSEVSTQFDGIGVVRDIEKADQLVNEAWEETDEEKIEKAIDLRPYDWRLREQHGIFTLSQDDQEGWELMHSDWIIEDMIKNGADCVQLRTEQLEYRVALLHEKIVDEGELVQDPDDEAYDAGFLLAQYEMQREQINAQDELHKIYATGQTRFCNNK